MLTSFFTYQDGELWCDGVRLNKIGNTVGTPVYIYGAEQVTQNVRQIQAAFPQAAIHYSLKANANLAIIRHLARLGIGMDAVSGGEIFRAVQAGIEPANIVFAGVGKTEAEIGYALDVGVGWFNVENVDELRLLNELAGKKGQKAAVALRLNPNVQAQTHHYIATGHGGAKFGMDADTVARVLEHQADYPTLDMCGIHIHIGSQLGNVAETVEAVQRAQALAQPYDAIRTLNIGGGFPVNYTEADHYPTLENFAYVLNEITAGWQLKLEPGRFIIANAGVLLISTLYSKTQAGKTFAITDGSMTELIRPALYQAVHPVIPVKQSKADLQETVVTGPVCESADVLHSGALLPPLVAGDRLAVLVAGAYGFVMASNYNQRLRPAEVLVEGESWRVIRRRETWEDLIRLEI